MHHRELLKDKKKIVIKIGSSSLIHTETGGVDFRKLEKLVRIICDLKNQDKDVVLVSSGAIGVGSQALGLKSKPKTVSLKQACAAIGQGQLMMMYQKLFMEYNHLAAQVLLTFDAITDEERRRNAENTLNELLQQDVIPVVNENDTVWIVGDIGNPEILSFLNGRKKIILGNHDDKEKLKSIDNLDIYDYPIMVGPLWLSHEPILYMPPESPYLNIHGHIHSFTYGKGTYWKDGRRHFNVSVENINYTPISADEIKKILKYIDV